MEPLPKRSLLFSSFLQFHNLVSTIGQLLMQDHALFLDRPPMVLLFNPYQPSAWVVVALLAVHILQSSCSYCLCLPYPTHTHTHPTHLERSPSDPETWGDTEASHLPEISDSTHHQVNSPCNLNMTRARGGQLFWVITTSEKCIILQLYCPSLS